MEKAVDFSLTLLGCFLRQCLCGDSSQKISPIMNHLSYIYNLALLYISVGCIYVIRLYFGPEGANHDNFMGGWICTGDACETVFVYKIVAAVIIYHIGIIAAITVASFKNSPAFALSIFESYWPIKMGYIIMLVSFFVIIVPEALLVWFQSLFVVYAAVFLLCLCFCTVAFGYGTIDTSIALSERRAKNDSIGDGTSIPYPNVKNYYSVVFYALTLLLFIYIICTIVWIVQVTENYSNCHINAVVMISYVSSIFLGIIFTVIHNQRTENSEMSGFVFTVIVGMSTYFIWNVVVFDDPMNCTKDIFIGERLHVYTVAVFLLFFTIYSVYLSIQPEKNWRNTVKCNVAFHYLISGCFCYLSLFIIDWSVAIDFEGKIIQETLTTLPLILHSFSVIFLFVIFCYSLFQPACASPGSLITPVSQITTV